MLKEIHTIRTFRGTDLGIIRLDNLAKPEKMKITIGGIEVNPIAFDTYGHPIISASNFIYYQALKENYGRKEITFLTEVSYEPAIFCYRRDVYDSIESIEKAIIGNKENKENEKEDKQLKALKELLILRKQAAFLKNELKNFILYGKYLLSEDGHIYSAYDLPISYRLNCGEKDVVEINNNIDLSTLKEIHIPGSEDVCAICGESFTLNDVRDDLITENERVEKVHCKCYENFNIEVELNKASQIIDAVYEGKPPVEIRKEWDDKDQKEKIWYIFKTKQGTISIRFKNKVIVIEWHDNFKPFNMKIFDEERVTKYDRGIHAWSKDDAIRYISMAKKA